MIAKLLKMAANQNLLVTLLNVLEAGFLADLAFNGTPHGHSVTFAAKCVSSQHLASVTNFCCETTSILLSIGSGFLKAMGGTKPMVPWARNT